MLPGHFIVNTAAVLCCSTFDLVMLFSQSKVAAMPAHINKQDMAAVSQASCQQLTGGQFTKLDSGAKSETGPVAVVC
jgi:hypothetical protein